MARKHPNKRKARAHKALKGESRKLKHELTLLKSAKTSKGSKQLRKHADKEGQAIVESALEIADLAAQGLVVAQPELMPVYLGIKETADFYDKLAPKVGLPKISNVIGNLGSAIGLI